MYNKVDTSQMIYNQQTEDRLNRFQQQAERERLADKTNKRAPKRHDGLLATAMTVVSATLLNGS